MNRQVLGHICVEFEAERGTAMRMLLSLLLSVGISVSVPVLPAYAEWCPSCCTNNCIDCSTCKPKVDGEVSSEMPGCDENTPLISQELTDGSEFMVAAIVKCSECMGKCETAYHRCRGECAPNDRGCLIQCQELSSQCQQNCKQVNQCE